MAERLEVLPGITTTIHARLDVISVAGRNWLSSVYTIGISA
jgi:hypothetical protein